MPLIIMALFWAFSSFKYGMLFVSLFSICIYIHITLTTLTNALTGGEVYNVGSSFWKLLFIFIFCISTTLFFVL